MTANTFKGKEREGKGREGNGRKGKERKGKERKGNNDITLCYFRYSAKFNIVEGKEKSETQYGTNRLN